MTSLWIQRVARLVGVLVLFGVPIKGAIELRPADDLSQRITLVQTTGLPLILDGRGRGFSIGPRPPITRIISTSFDGTFEGIGRSS